MATKTFTVSKQYMADIYGGAANPGDLHIPIGRWDPGTGLTWTTRALVYAPVSFSGMTAINEARLYFRAHAPASGWHAKGATTTSLYALRKTADWSETSGGVSSAVDELWGGDGDAFVESGYASVVSGDFANIPGMTHNNWYYITITGIVQSWFGGSANYGIMVYNAGSETSAAYAKEFWSRHASGSQPYIWIDYATNTAPAAPVSLSPTGDAVRHTGSSVVLTGTRSDVDAGDYISQYQTQVLNDALTTTYHDAYTTPGGTPTTFSKTVSGLPTNVFLEWRARTRDKDNVWGPWSGYQRFKLNTVPNAPTLALLESPTTSVKTLTPTLRVTHSDADPGDSQAHKYQIELQTSAGAAVWNSGEVTITPVTTVSRLYNGSALSWGASYRWRARTQDMNGQWSAYSGWATFTIHKTGVPVSLSPTGGAVVGGLVPTFAGSRATTADSLTSAEVEVYDSTGATLIWSSGASGTGVTSTGFSRAYAGTTLAYATSYRWRARVTSSVGGVSDWSALQAFSTPAADAIQTTAPIGSSVATLTPSFQFSRTNSFNAYQIVLYAANGTTVLWDSGTVTHASDTSRSIVYPGTPALAWATAYQWKVRVSSDSGSTWGGGYTSLISFETETAGSPDLVAPVGNAWLGTPHVVEAAESLTGVTGSANSTVTLDTTLFSEGAASLRAALASLNGTQSVITIVRSLDLSPYGGKTPITAAVRASSLTSLSNVRLRFVDGGGAWAEYTITPTSVDAWQDKTVAKDSPVATSGTINWANIASIVVRATTSASATLNLWVDSIRLDAINPSFDGTTSAGETISTVRVMVYASDQTTVVWDSGNVAGSGTAFSMLYGGSALAAGATYFWTARYVSSVGPTGGWSPMRAFVLNSAPNAPSSRTPSTGAVISGVLTPEFTANFTDPDLAPRGDLPSAYEVQVVRNSDDVVMHALRSVSGLVAGPNTLQRTSEGTALSYEVEYKWRARYVDSLGSYGSWSSYNVFKPSQPPTVAITAPVSTVNSPSFNVAWSFASAASKAQNRFRVTITRNADSALVYDSGLVFSSVSGHTIPGGFLVNSTGYTIAVVANDSDGLDSAEDTAAITTAWTAPDSIEGFSVSALEDTSEMLLVWDQTNLGASDFSYYQIYRREQGSGDWLRYVRITNMTQTEYSDFYAGHGMTYEYKITVWKKVVGDVDIESSDSEIPYAILDPDSWFFVGADRDASHIFELPVYDESHTEPIQQEVFEPLGSRRKSIVRGKVLGAEGTMQVQWTDSERTAAKVYLRYMADTPGPHILKSPFGDVWLVEFSGSGKKYLGGGHLTVTLTWIEVI